MLAHPADSALRAATAALDSATTRFALARAALDSDAATLRDANRLDSAYARRYDAFEATRRNVRALRDARDRARRERDVIAECGGAAKAKQCGGTGRR
mgnify:FL=1